jgi:hypothetical protein
MMTKTAPPKTPKLSLLDRARELYKAAADVDPAKTAIITPGWSYGYR